MDMGGDLNSIVFEDGNVVFTEPLGSGDVEKFGVFITVDHGFDFTSLLPKENFLPDGTLKRSDDDQSKGGLRAGERAFLLKAVDPINDSFAIDFALVNRSKGFRPTFEVRSSTFDGGGKGPVRGEGGLGGLSRRPGVRDDTFASRVESPEGFESKEAGTRDMGGNVDQERHVVG